MSYFRVFEKELTGCKNKHPAFLTKFFIEILLVFRFVLGAFLHFNVGFAFITLIVQTVTAA